LETYLHVEDGFVPANLVTPLNMTALIGTCLVLIHLRVLLLPLEVVCMCFVPMYENGWIPISGSQTVYNVNLYDRWKHARNTHNPVIDNQIVNLP